MKASKLKNALMYIGDDDDVEFAVGDGKTKGLVKVAQPTHAEIKTEWPWPERGDLTPVHDPDKLPKCMTIFLET